MRRLVTLALVLAAIACGGGNNVPGLGSASAAVSDGEGDEGTKLTVTTGEAALECSADGTAADVTVPYTLVSTAGNDSAVVTASIDGGEPFEIGTIASGSPPWIANGREKTATGEATFTLSSGTHTIVICAEQSGSNGRLPKADCSDALTVTVECPPPEQKSACNQGVGNGPEGCDPGNSNHRHGSNDENGGTPGNPGRKGGGR